MSRSNPFARKPRKPNWTVLAVGEGETERAFLQFLKGLLPEGVRAIQEDKQVSACVVRTQGSELTGSSINEVVTWGRA